jgi:hypothetical protein
MGQMNMGGAVPPHGYATCARLQPGGLQQLPFGVTPLYKKLTYDFSWNFSKILFV